MDERPLSSEGERLRHAENLVGIGQESHAGLDGGWSAFSIRGGSEFS
jgi:hypothetical protein